MITVSVIIPTFNRRWSLPRAVASARAQTVRDLEIIVVDDGSSDDTAELDLARDDPRVRVIRSPRNEGVSAARNRGLAHGSAPLVAFLDSDDEWQPDKLERQADRLARAASRDVGAVASGLRFKERDGREITWRPTADEWSVPRLLSGAAPYDCASMWLVRREHIDALGSAFDPVMRYAQMRDLLVRLTAVCRLDAVDEPLTIVHEHDTEPRNTRFAADEKLRSYTRFVEKHRAQLGAFPAADALLTVTMARWLFDAGRTGDARAALVRAFRRHPTAWPGVLRVTARHWLRRPSALHR